jgi:hypothetical protein
MPTCRSSGKTGSEVNGSARSKGDLENIKKLAAIKMAN